MVDPVEDVSRAAALQLSDDFGPGLVGDVEEALFARAGTGRPERYFDPISLGGLVVSVATLVWTVYRDMRRAKQPSREVLARRIRVEVETPSAVTPSERDRVIDVVVSEVLTSGRSRDMS